MKEDPFKSSNDDFTFRKKNLRKKYAIIIVSFIVIISVVSIPVVIYAYNAIKMIFNYNPELPCEDLPDIKIVRQVVEDHQDVIQEIKNLNPDNIWVSINERCNGKGELFIYYDTVSNKEKI